MRHTAFSILAIALFFSVPSAAFSEGTRVKAKSMEHKGGVYTLTGSAQVFRDNAKITADSIVYDEATGETVAKGNVYYDDPAVTIRAERAEVNLLTNTGVLYEAYMFVKAEGFHIRSPEMRKTAKDRYSLTNARATTCDATPAAWCLGGKEVDIHLGERLIAWHATLSLRDIPVFYYPYVWAPIVSERRTGFLNPKFGYRKTLGVNFQQQFFWAIADNRDATFTLDVYTKRGIGEGVEYRYVERPDLEGKLNLYHIRDNDLDRDFYEFKGRHRQAVGFADINLVNYREFYREYETYIDDSSKRFLESQAEVFAPLGSARLYLAARYLQDLKDGVDQDTLPQRLPEAGFFLSPSALGPVVVSGTASATNIERDEGSDGQRYEAGMTASHFYGQGTTFSQALGLKELYYSLDHTDEGTEPNFHNTLYDYSATVQWILQRQFTNIKHELEPSFSYNYIARDGEEPDIFDSTEDMEERSAASFSLNNRLKDAKGDLLILKLTQGYDFEEPERPFETLELEMTLKRPFYFTATANYNTYDGRMEEMSSKAVFSYRSTSLTAEQTLSEPTDVETYRLSVLQRVTSSLAFKGKASYDSSEEEDLEELALSLIYQSQCWGVTLSVVDEPDDFGVFLEVSLLGLGSYKAEVFATEETPAEE
jgi:LPS-assembly protein